MNSIPQTEIESKSFRADIPEGTIRARGVGSAGYHPLQFTMGGLTSAADGELVQAWASFAQDMAPWDWFYTLTFARRTHPEAANKAFMRWTHRINRRVFGVRYTRRGQGVRWIRAMEFQRRGVLHYHGLMADVGGLRRFDWMAMWEELAGFARIFPYDAERGAAHYVAKYAAKQAVHGEIDVGGPLQHSTLPFGTCGPALAPGRGLHQAPWASNAPGGAMSRPHPPATGG